MSTPSDEVAQDPPVPGPIDPATVEEPAAPAPDSDPDEGVPFEEPDETEAEAQAAAEREALLAAERQAEAQSLEAQQRDQDAKWKKLDQLAGHVAKRYGEILGPDLDGFEGCPLCAPWFPGIRLPVMPDYETVAAVKVAIGEDPDPPLINDQYSRECESCSGLGKVRTGSKVSGQQTAQCIPCKGRGWVSIGPEREAGAITTPAAVFTPQTNGENLTAGDEPPEAAALKALGYIVVPPMSALEAVTP